MDVTGRDHFKSTRFYADIMWNLLRDAEGGSEGWYFSYSYELAAYHLSKIKEMVRDNPIYYDIVDHKSTAESVLSYSWPGSKKRITVHPGGLLAFKRGIHADHIYVDDPLRDPENKLKPTVITKINRIVKTELLPMINKGGTCRIVGTPQTPDDFFFDEGMQRTFKTWITPAIIDEVQKLVLWPEWKSYDDLMLIKDQQGEKIFAQEYMASPVYSEDSYIEKPMLLAVIDPKLEPLKFKEHTELNDAMVVAAFDIGKKRHPSHLAVFKRIQREDVVRFVQLFSKWMDHWDYKDQLDYLVNAINYFRIHQLRYDNTRGEFEGFKEQGKIPPQMKPVTYNNRTQVAIAAQFGTAVEQKNIKLLNDARQTGQILAVTGDLQAIESPEGHGDSFWSVATAIYEDKKERKVRWL